MSRNAHGFTLVELLIVVVILGVAASVAIPDLATGNPTKLDLAANEIAGAMRFARSESMRQGSPHGFNQQTNNRRIRVFRADTNVSPWSPIYDVYHPLSKQLYDMDLDDHPFASADGMSHNRVYRGSCNTPGDVYFDGNGTPWCTNPETVLLDYFEIALTSGQHTRTVRLQGITGRVTIQ